MYRAASTGNENFEEWRKKQEQDREAEKGFSFTPEINKTSSKLAKSQQGSGGKGDKQIFDRLYDDFKSKKEHLEAELNVRQVEEVSECTFAPKINEYIVSSEEKKSEMGMALDDRIEKLYENGVKKVAKKRNAPKNDLELLKMREEAVEYQEYCTFHPKTTWKKVFGEEWGNNDDEDEGIEGEDEHDFVDHDDDVFGEQDILLSNVEEASAGGVGGRGEEGGEGEGEGEDSEFAEEFEGGEMEFDEDYGEGEKVFTEEYEEEEEEEEEGEEEEERELDDYGDEEVYELGEGGEEELIDNEDYTSSSEAENDEGGEDAENDEGGEDNDDADVFADEDLFGDDDGLDFGNLNIGDDPSAVSSISAADLHDPVNP